MVSRNMVSCQKTSTYLKTTKHKRFLNAYCFSCLQNFKSLQNPRCKYHGCETSVGNCFNACLSLSYFWYDAVMFLLCIFIEQPVRSSFQNDIKGLICDGLMSQKSFLLTLDLIDVNKTRNINEFYLFVKGIYVTNDGYSYHVMDDSVSYPNVKIILIYRLTRP